MEKLKMSSPDMLSENVEKIAALFPSCVTETAEGKAIDFDLLKQELNKDIIEGNKERYTLNWPGKKEAIVTANIPTTQTLRPVKEDSVNWDTTENLYIEGDNLEVLKILQESYLNKVKMIYIDPPYNTGTAMIYNNDFSLDKDIYQEMSGDIDKYGNRLKINNGTDGRLHSNWLSMMYTRIKLSSHLLKKDGFMVIAIDHYELHNLITICDNIFGESNRLGIVSMLHNPEGRQNAKYFTVTNEYFLVYSKSQQSKFNGVVLQENVKNSKDILKEYNLKDERGFYKEKSYMRKGGGDLSLRINKPNAWYPLYVSKDLNDISLNFHKGYEEIFPITDSGQERTWNLVKDSFKSKYNSGEIYAIKKDEKIQICEKYRIDKGSPITTNWINNKYNSKTYGSNLLEELFGFKVFSYPKSLYSVYDVLKIMTNSEDTILDFFSGSSTTAHATMQLNFEDKGKRKFIMIQIPEIIDENTNDYKNGFRNICDIAKERIRRAGYKILEESKTKVGELEFDAKEENKLDIGFRVYRLDSSNMQDVYYTPQDYKQDNMDLFADNVKADRTPDDLLAQVMLDWGLPLSLDITEETILNKTIYKVAGNSLFACFDDGIDEDFAKEVAKSQPMRMVFKDSNFKDDTSKENVKQLLKQLSPETEMRVI